ncbi:MAG TPA: inositol monophosphatase family protein [Blastocatellia bacterium]
MRAYAAHLETAVEAATRAGQLIRKAFGQALNIQTKTNARDLLTDVDTRSQETIIGTLTRDFPDIPILAEEGERKNDGGELLWLVDPLDGTTNFTRGIELFSVSICLSLNQTPVAAVVYHPVLDQLYTAERGHGAHLNGRRLAVSTISALDGFTVSSNLSYRNDERLVILENIRRLMTQTAGLRLIFAVALELCMVARGSFDAALIYQANPWDMAAGCLIAREAGGTVTNWAGDEWRITDANCLASNASQHDALLALLYAGE